MDETARSFLRRLVIAFVLSLGAAAYAAPVTLDLPAQPLSDSILQLSKLSGRGIAADSALVRGKEAQAVRGTMEPLAALNQLLAGSGLAADIASDGSFVIRKPGDKTLREVAVVAEEPGEPQEPAEGSADAGYLMKKTTAAGPIWGDVPLQDSPYSISVVPNELVQNLQAYQPEDIAKVIPQITNVLAQQNSTGNPIFYVRGFTISQFTNGAGLTYDGLPGGAGGMLATSLEDKERVELLSGTTGFLYGTGSVGGNLNYALKRPTPTTYANVTAGDNAGNNGYVHGDFGGPIDKDGIFGYRINVVDQDGQTSIRNQTIKRDLFSGAFDIHPSSDILLQFNAAYSDYRVAGQTPSFTTSLNPVPAPADPATIGTPSWAQFADRTDTVGAKLTWKLNDIFTLRTDWDYTREARPYNLNFSSDIVNYSGLLTQKAGGSSEIQYWHTHSAYTYLDSEFSTWGIQHELTAGFSGYTQTNTAGLFYDPFVPNSNANNLYNESFPSKPMTTVSSYDITDYTQYATNYVIGDAIKVTDKFTILAGGNYTGLGNRTTDQATGAVVGTKYGKSALTPTTSFVYKILPWLSTYATYQESLLPGVQVLNGDGYGDGVIYTNNGAVLPPYLGREGEIGVKATLREDFLATVAVFEISEANIYTQYNADGTATVFEGGRQINKGIEFTATGKITPDLAIVSGLTLLDPRIVDNPDTPAQNGSMAENVSHVSGKIYAEYNVPVISAMSFLRGLTLIGGFHTTSDYYADLPNTQRYPGYVVGDLGFRYAAAMGDHLWVIRFNVNNITNNAYWQSPGREGQPRTFLATIQFKW